MAMNINTNVQSLNAQRNTSKGCNCSTLWGVWSRLTPASYLITTNLIKIGVIRHW